MQSAPLMVDNRWAIEMVVRPAPAWNWRDYGSSLPSIDYLLECSLDDGFWFRIEGRSRLVEKKNLKEELDTDEDSFSPLDLSLVLVQWRFSVSVHPTIGLLHHRFEIYIPRHQRSNNSYLDIIFLTWGSFMTKSWALAALQTLIISSSLIFSLPNLRLFSIESANRAGSWKGVPSLQLSL